MTTTPADRHIESLTRDPHPEADSMARLYREGFTLQQIGQRYGRSKSYIVNQLEALGVARRPMTAPRASRISAATQAAILAYWEQNPGSTMRAVSAATGMGYSTVYTVLHRAGVQRPQRQELLGPLGRERRAQAHALKAQGLTRAEIAEQIGVSVPYVYALLRPVVALTASRDFTPERACELYQRGLTANQVAQWLKASPALVRLAVEEAGIQRGPWRPRKRTTAS